MPFNPEIHHRRSIRLKEYNYTEPGFYFITICTQQRLCLFGKIIHGQMLLNKAGFLIEQIWQDLPHKFPFIFQDNYVIMPNHIHGLIQIIDKTEHSISHIVQYFKSFSSFQYILGVKQNNWEHFPGKLWQRNYYEHIARNENNLEKIRQYILNNPIQWEMDQDNPINCNNKIIL